MVPMQYLQSWFPKESLELLKEPTNLYLKGDIKTFTYYYIVSQIVGLQSLHSAIQLLLQEFEGFPASRNALRCYHELVQSRRCPRCNEIVFYPDEIRLNQTWHRQCIESTLKA